MRKLFLIALFIAFLLMGSLYALAYSSGDEKACNEGEYQASSIAYPETGRVCVKKGTEPPSGYRRFPSGQEPKV